MNIFKSHFWYNKNQRNGILFLIILIVVLQSIISFVDFTSNETLVTNTPELLAFQQQIDSLKQIEIEKRSFKKYPFNPNYISDFKGEQLGMSLEEIDRLFAFRKTGKFINSKKEFQKVTKISDSLLIKISPLFTFPDWVLQRNANLRKEKKVTSKIFKSSFNKKVTTKDINKATQEDFKTIYGIGEKLSQRIIKYRSKLQGFSMETQVNEVWGIEAEVRGELLEVFSIIEKPIIVKTNVNTATFKEVLKNPYIDFELCKKIFEYRNEVAELQDIVELKNIENFPLDKYDRIVLYLLAE